MHDIPVALRSSKGNLSPITVLMLESEEREGRVACWPDSAPEWLRPDDWRGWPVIAIAKDEVHIIAIWSARKGALTDLIASIKQAGRNPVIVEPMGKMVAILQRWNWKKRIIGSGWESREEWRPQ